MLAAILTLIVWAILFLLIKDIVSAVKSALEASPGAFNHQPAPAYLYARDDDYSYEGSAGRAFMAMR